MASRRTELQHFVQKYDWDCGIACIQMILLKLGEVSDDSAIYKLTASLEISESVWTIDLANILRHFKVESVYYTVTCGVDPSYKDKEYYKDDFNTEETRVNMLFKTATDIGINIVKKSITMADILSMLDSGYVAIVLVDSSDFTCNFCAKKNNTMDPTIYSIFSDNSEKQYHGHYIVLCGYNTHLGVIYCKNPSLADVECCVNIPVFDMARKRHGTDEDIIFVKIKTQ